MPGILLPLDTSDLSRAALPHALALARTLKEPIVLVGVWDQTDQDLGGVLTAVQTEETRRVALQIYRDELERTAALCDVDTMIDVREGRPADEILASMVEHRASMMVISTHGRGGMQRAVWGSVADKLVHASPLPVLVVHTRTAAPAEWSPARIAVPLDGSERAEGALTVARQVAAASGATVSLIRVVPWAAATIGFPMMPVIDSERIESELEDAARQYLSGVAAAGETIEVLRGAPGEGIVHFAESNEINLIVMTSHGRTGFLRWALGSVADRILKAGTAPVLLVPARD